MYFARDFSGPLPLESFSFEPAEPATMVVMKAGLTYTCPVWWSTLRLYAGINRKRLKGKESLLTDYPRLSIS